MFRTVERGASGMFGRGDSLLLVAPMAVLLAIVLITPASVRHLIAGDLGLYLGDGGQLLAGTTPYRGFPLEYPPLALLPMAAPQVAWPFGTLDEAAFAWPFALFEGGLAVIVGWLLRRISDRPTAAVATWGLLVLAAAPSVAWRYDLWPAAAVLIAIVAAERGRPGLAGAAIGVGTMMKLFPIVVLPVLAARSVVLGDRAGLRRLVLGAAAVVGGTMLGSLAAAGTDALQWMTYEVDRGLQLESVGAGALLLLHALAGYPVAIDRAFGSLQLAAPGAAAVAALTPALSLVLVSMVTALAFVRFRVDRARLGQVPLATLAGASVAVILALLLTSKVFSVQYVVWILPLVPLLPWPQRVLALVTAALSTVIHPLNYAALWGLDPVMTLVLNVRNALLIALLAWLTVRLARPGSPAGRRTRVAARATPHGASGASWDW